VHGVGHPPGGKLVGVDDSAESGGEFGRVTTLLAVLEAGSPC
jgi:hypothetical protein